MEYPLLNEFRRKKLGVEFRKLGEVCEKITKGTTPKIFSDTGINFIKVESISLDRLDKNKLYYITEDIHNNFLKRSILQENDVLFCIAGSIGKTLLVTKEMLPANTNQALAIIRVKENINPNFVKYILSSEYMKIYIQKQITGGAQPNLNLQNLSNFEIPIPPLEIQEEIVRILDIFTKDTNELIELLKREKELRKKQYSYYRDKLLTFDSNIQYKNLSEICSFIYGYTEKAKDEGNARFVRITDILETGYLNPEEAKYINLTSECEKYLLKKGDLLTARAGATYGKTLYFDEDYPAVYASYLIKLNLDNNLILNRYYWHFTKSSYYWKQANKLAVGGAQPNLNANSLAKIVVPLPPLDAQKRIVDILDKFDQYCNSLQEGLPAEIEARKKQYNFYRDKLLTFERK